MKLRISVVAPVVAAFALGACGTTGQGQDASDPNRIEYPTPDAALTAVRARPGITETQRSDGWNVIQDDARRETWLFSTPGNPVHPAVVKQTVVKKFGESTTVTAALCSASQADCDRVVAQLQAGANSPDQMRQSAQPTTPTMRSGGRY